jgi:hypothetical protein
MNDGLLLLVQQFNHPPLGPDQLVDPMERCDKLSIECCSSCGGTASMQTKDEVLAELMAEHIALKKVLGNSNRDLCAA